MKYYVIRITKGIYVGKYLGTDAYGSPKFRKSIKAKKIYRFNLESDAKRLIEKFAFEFKNGVEIIEVVE